MQSFERKSVQSKDQISPIEKVEQAEEKFNEEDRTKDGPIPPSEKLQKMQSFKKKDQRTVEDTPAPEAKPKKSGKSAEPTEAEPSKDIKRGAEWTRVKGHNVADWGKYGSADAWGGGKVTKSPSQCKGCPAVGGEHTKVVVKDGKKIVKHITTPVPKGKTITNKSIFTWRSFEWGARRQPGILGKNWRPSTKCGKLAASRSTFIQTHIVSWKTYDLNGRHLRIHRVSSIAESRSYIYWSEESAGSESFLAKISKVDQGDRGYWLNDRRTKTLRSVKDPNFVLSNENNNGRTAGSRVVVRRFDKRSSDQVLTDARTFLRSKTHLCAATRGAEHKDTDSLIWAQCNEKEKFQRWSFWQVNTNQKIKNTNSKGQRQPQPKRGRSEENSGRVCKKQIAAFKIVSKGNPQYWAIVSPQKQGKSQIVKLANSSPRERWRELFVVDTRTKTIRNAKLREHVLSNQDGQGTTVGGYVVMRKWTGIAEPDQSVSIVGNQIKSFGACIGLGDNQFAPNAALKWETCAGTPDQSWNVENFEGKWDDEKWGPINPAWVIEKCTGESTKHERNSKKDRAPRRRRLSDTHTFTPSNKEQEFTATVVNEVVILKKPLIKKLKSAKGKKGRKVTNFVVVKPARVAITRRNGETVVKTVRNKCQLERLDQKVRQQQRSTLYLVKNAASGKSLQIIQLPRFGTRYFQSKKIHFIKRPGMIAYRDLQGKVTIKKISNATVLGDLERLIKVRLEIFNSQRRFAIVRKIQQVPRATIKIIRKPVFKNGQMVQPAVVRHMIDGKSVTKKYTDEKEINRLVRLAAEEKVKRQAAIRKIQSIIRPKVQFVRRPIFKFQVVVRKGKKGVVRKIIKPAIVRIRNDKTGKYEKKVIRSWPEFQKIRKLLKAQDAKAQRFIRKARKLAKPAPQPRQRTVWLKLPVIVNG